MKNIRIRNLEEEDLIQIAELAGKCSPMITEKNSVYHLFTKFFKRTSFVVEDHGKGIMGFLLGFISQENINEAYIHLLCVKPGFKKEGLASCLLKNLFEVLKAAGCRRVFLVTNPRNKVAISFYKDLGFTEYETDQTMNINGLKVARDYSGPGDHRVVFFKMV